MYSPYSDWYSYLFYSELNVCEFFFLFYFKMYIVSSSSIGSTLPTIFLNQLLLWQRSLVSKDPVLHYSFISPLAYCVETGHPEHFCAVFYWPLCQCSSSSHGHFSLSILMKEEMLMPLWSWNSALFVLRRHWHPPHRVLRILSTTACLNLSIRLNYWGPMLTTWVHVDYLSEALIWSNN